MFPVGLYLEIVYDSTDTNLDRSITSDEYSACEECCEIRGTIPW